MRTYSTEFNFLTPDSNSSLISLILQQEVQLLLSIDLAQLINTMELCFTSAKLMDDLLEIGSQQIQLVYKNPIPFCHSFART